MTTSHNNNIPKMKINKFRQILDLPQINEFNVPLINTTIDMTIHIDNSKTTPITYFIFHSSFQVYGWTTNSTKAFKVKNNASLYSPNELYDLMRGETI